jgi:hypothetical protein
MAKGMMFFNPKMMRELSAKLGELEEIKKEWIHKERSKCDPLPCKLEHQ